MAKKKQRKYTITLTEEQMMLIANCLEDIHRFLAGRTELWHTTSVLDNARDVQYRMAEMAKVVTPELGRGMNYDWAGSNCPNEHQKKMIAQTYYLYREMLHQYTIANRHKNVYSSKTLRCEDSEEPIKITWEDK